MYVVVSVDRNTSYCCAYGPYENYFDADTWRLKMMLENAGRIVHVINLESPR